MATTIIEPKHPDFQQIWRMFMRRYCGSYNDVCKLGKTRYYSWLNARGLDDTKPYRVPQERHESFKWIDKQTINYWKSDRWYKYYKVEVGCVITSLNYNLYTEDELIRGARSLPGKETNWNHNYRFKISTKDVKIVDAEYEDEVVESVIAVRKTAKATWPSLKGKLITDCLDEGDVVDVSLEADCKGGNILTPQGRACKRLFFFGFAFLTKEELPGIPVTRIIPLEKLFREMIFSEVQELNKTNEKEGADKEEAQWTTAYINDLPDSSFAYIAPGGKKDDDGKTTPRSLRHLPFKDAGGNIDLPHLRNALARLQQTKLSGAGKAAAKKKLCSAAKSVGLKSQVCGTEASDDTYATKESKGSKDSKDNKDSKETSEPCSHVEKIAKLEYDLSELRREHRKLEEERDTLNARLEAKETKLNDCAVKVNDLEKEIEGLEGKLSHANQIHKEDVDAKADLTGENAKLKAKNEELIEEMGGLKAENSRLQSKVTDLQTELVGVRETLNERQALLNEEQKGHYSVAEEVTKLRKKLTQRNEEHERDQERIHKLEEELKKAKRHGRKIVKLKL